MFKKIIALAISAGLLFAASAHADEADVKKAVESVLGKNARVDSVRKAGVLGLYEVVVGGEIVYVDEKAGYLIFGNIVDVKAKKDLTEERKLKLAQIKFSDLPLDLAIKQIKGNGKRIVATFEDPNCGYCKKLAKELVGMTDVTIYTFLYPILSPDSLEKSKNIWCASDKAKSWNDWMVNGSAPAAAKCDASAVDKTVAFGQKLNIRGTPTIFFTDGSRAPGYMPVAQLEKAIAAAGN
ncbi:MAG: DsbC family protein [Sulfurisoma sp.]|nr:DsbC family protein [Sulfurisoma sp.]